MVTTVAARKSALRTSFCSTVTRSASPSRSAGSRLGHTQTIQVETDRPAAVVLRGRDEDAAVAAAEVIDHVLGSHTRQCEHPRDDIVRCHHVLDEDDGSRRALLERAGQSGRFFRWLGAVAGRFSGPGAGQTHRRALATAD
jgi:hypothetical protein